tara:strand:- start:249 stop:440 length:192 start_codon:yes stop_codon:yes gene_type:complete
MKVEINKNKSWQDKRIDAINRKIRHGKARGYSAQNIAENYIEEHFNVCNSKAKNKKEYKASLK